MLICKISFNFDQQAINTNKIKIFEEIIEINIFHLSYILYEL